MEAKNVFLVVWFAAFLVSWVSHPLMIRTLQFPHAFVEIDPKGFRTMHAPSQLRFERYLFSGKLFRLGDRQVTILAGF